MNDRRIRQIRRYFPLWKRFALAFGTSVVVQIGVLVCAAFEFLDTSAWPVMFVRIAAALVCGISFLLFIVCFKRWAAPLSAALQDENLPTEKSNDAFELVMDILRHRSTYAPRIIRMAESVLVAMLSQDPDRFPIAPDDLVCLYACLKQPDDRIIMTVLKTIERHGTETAVPCLRELIDNRDSTLHDESIYTTAQKTLSVLEARLCETRNRQ